MMRNYSRVYLSEKSERSVRAGHPWVYGEEIIQKAGEFKNGDIVDVYSRKERYLGTGFYNDNSKIAVRIISKNPNDTFDEAFFERRVRYAVDYRRTVMPDEDFSACRLIFGEADFFPGLTIDLFGDILVTEVLSLGTEQRKNIIYRGLIKVLKENGIIIRAIYERNESPLRLKEGLELNKGFVSLPGLEQALDGHVIITENGIKYDIDYINGQKTGFFLDQKYNRLSCARIARGKKVLDCCTHTGAFALNAAKNGALSVTAVDVSQDALDSAAKNAELNGLTEKLAFVKSDVFEFLSSALESKKQDYDFIILDPPAFTKSSSTVNRAYKGYKDINYKAMKLLPRGGYLATCSCSHFMTDELFEKMLFEAAFDADVRLHEIEIRHQAPDHPVLWGVPETRYLKFYLFQII